MISKQAVLRSVADRFWEMACEYDDIPTDSKVSAFYGPNPFLELYKKNKVELQELQQKEKDQNG